MIGVLALQGAVKPHLDKFESIGVSAIAVRYPQQLDNLQGLVLPGGESSSQLILLQKFGWINALNDFAKSHALWGVCAGCIIMSEKVVPQQQSLGVIAIESQRNAYGRQNESFIGKIEAHSPNLSASERFLEGLFIRAPKIKCLDDSTTVLGTCDNEVVAATNNMHLITTFHPELTQHTQWHKYFINLAQSKIYG